MYRTVTARCLYSEIFPKFKRHLANLKVDKAQNKDSQDTDEVKFDHVNKTGIILLNKPKALNALSLSMIRTIYSKMKVWETDGKTELVIIKSTTPKAFCAGGDIKALTGTSRESEEARNRFFREEYRLNYLTGNYSLPYIAIINGITMGGGCGLSVHGPFRVATETTMVAMPETAIGLFPDVGGSHFLPRLHNNLGIFLGLTGHRLRGIDTLHAGVATHYIPTSKLPEIEEILMKIPNKNLKTVKDVLDNNCETKNNAKTPFSLEDKLQLIDRLFSIDTKDVETIFDQLRSDGSEFALKQLSILEKMSPTSLKLTFEQIKRGRNLDLKDCLIMEAIMGENALKGHDFFEGVRAVLIDKDNKPRWKPNSLKDIAGADIDRYFEKSSSHEDLQLD